MRTRHRLYLDDAFLFFGLVCLCTATGFAYALLHSGYLEEGFVAHPNQTIPSDDVSKVLKRLRMVDVFVVFAWTAEFSVKVSLLLFFRQLVDRLPRLTTYVNFAMGFTVLVWAFLVGELFIVCQHLGIQTISEHCLGNRQRSISLH